MAGHNASSDDRNLIDFRKTLERTYDNEQIKGDHRKILGIYVGWRGRSWSSRFSIVELATFWWRQSAGRRVATGSVRELFGRLRRYRNNRKDDAGEATVLVMGHSFGGMIVYSALAQSLIEAASTPPEEQVTTRYVDLVLLLNPAIEGARYLPIYDLLKERANLRPSNVRQLEGAMAPVFMSVTSQADSATGKAFPIGNYVWRWMQKYTSVEEKEAGTKTIGHINWFKTHNLTLASDGKYKIESLSQEPQPFWVVSASKDVIKDHNDIFNETITSFIHQQVFVQAEEAKLQSIKMRAKIDQKMK